MFTGLIADLGELVALERQQRGATLKIATSLAAQIAMGDSVAVNGVCLTATEVDEHGFSAQAIPETLERSSLGSLRAGARVNLELALAADGRLGGHIVQGHVDGVGTVSEIRAEGSSRVLSIHIPAALARYLVHKGSVALDGVSLTVSALSEEHFSVSLIPETLKRTTLGEIAVGDATNLEVDILAKHVERLLEARA
ncbi:MAG TPA: riboflavin synthase [Solirubrobacteraceae bacterium]